MSFKEILAICILIYGSVYGFLLLKYAWQAKKSNTPISVEAGSDQVCSETLSKENVLSPRFPVLAVTELIIYFLVSIGFPDYLIHNLIFQKTGWVKDEKIPHTLVAATVTPSSVIAFFYLRGEATLDVPTIILCTAATCAGTFFGSKIVTNLSGSLIRLVMAIAITCSIGALLLKIIVSSGASGIASGLNIPQLCIAVPILFVLGIFNMFGVPMKPSSTALFLLLGLSPMNALTLMIIVTAMGPIFGSFEVMKQKKYHRTLSVASVLFGTAGALIGIGFAISINSFVLNIILIVMMVFTAVTLFRKPSH